MESLHKFESTLKKNPFEQCLQVLSRLKEAQLGSCEESSEGRQRPDYKAYPVKQLVQYPFI